MNSNMRGTKIRRQEFKSQLLQGIMAKEDQFDILVCNPPFFKTKSEAFAANAKKNKNLHGHEQIAHNFGGSANELWYKGGEEAFIKTLAVESVQYQNQIKWFTCLVSKKENLRTFKRYIRKGNPSDIKVITMNQGNNTSQCIAWTFKQESNESRE